MTQPANAEPCIVCGHPGHAWPDRDFQMVLCHDHVSETAYRLGKLHSQMRLDAETQRAVSPLRIVDGDDLRRALTMAIDRDQPPGLAAAELARAVLSLVQDRDAKEAVHIAAAIADVAQRFPR